MESQQYPNIYILYIYSEVRGDVLWPPYGNNTCTSSGEDENYKRNVTESNEHNCEVENT